MPSAKVHNPTLWEQPKDISSEDLYVGRGGEENQPKAPFVFVSEAHGGTNPKFDVRDANDKKWRVKLGSEAGQRSRLLV